MEQENWADLERLFEGRGGPFYCWCTLWREKPPLPKEKTERRNMLKAVLRAQVDAGVPVGIVGYLADEPVGWCSIAPRGSYSRRLGGLPNEAENEAPVWAIACFFLRRQFRGQGLMKQLLQAAIAHARSRGAGVVEAYPVDPESPSYHSWVFTAFREAGLSNGRAHRHPPPHCQADLRVNNTSDGR